MGYELKAFIVSKYDAPHKVKDKDYSCGETIGMVDLCKCGEGEFDLLRLHYKNHPIINMCLWKFGHDGVSTEDWQDLRSQAIWQNENWKGKLTDAFYDEAVVVDKYGDGLVSIPAKEVLKALKQSNKKEKYRRFTLLIALLEIAIKDFKNEELYVVLYGH